MTFSNLKLSSITAMITVSKDGTVQSRRQICTSCNSQVNGRSNRLPFATLICNRHRTSTHWVEGSEAISPGEETLVFVLLGHGLHPSPLVLLFPCSIPVLLLWALAAFLPCFHILGLSFFCFSLPFGKPFYLSHASGCNFLSEVLPASCFHLSSSSCCLCVLFSFGDFF